MEQKFDLIVIGGEYLIDGDVQVNSVFPFW